MSRLQLQPRPKSTATSNLSSRPSFVSNEPLLSPETPFPHLNTRYPSADPISERATLFLIRRTLCSQLGEKGRSTPAPIDEILPPLTSSNEIDVQLYAFVAIIIREFVQTWYTKITPDQIFVQEVVKIIAHCTRALEQRLRKVDLESLLFDELPELLEVHVQGMSSQQYWTVVFEAADDKSSISSSPPPIKSAAISVRTSRDLSLHLSLSRSITCPTREG
jgi:hypothetical protein